MLKLTPGDHECVVKSCRQLCQAHLLLCAATQPLQGKHRLKSLSPSSNSANRTSVVTPSDHHPVFQRSTPISQIDRLRSHPPQIFPSPGVAKPCHSVKNLTASTSFHPGWLLAERSCCSLHPPPDKAAPKTLRIPSEFQDSEGNDKFRLGKSSAVADAGEEMQAHAAWLEGWTTASLRTLL